MPTVNDYLLDPDKADWPTLLQPWRELLPREFSIWLVNRFGDLFLVASDDSVNWLIIDEGILIPVATDWQEFRRRIDEGDNAEDMLHPTLIDVLVAAGKTLNPGECYGLRTSTLAGGAYSADNVVVRKLADQFAHLAPRPDATGTAVDDTPMSIRVDYHPDRSKSVAVPGKAPVAIKVDYGRKRTNPK